MDVGHEVHQGEGGEQEEANFGQSRFGHPDLTNFGQSNFGQSIFGHRGLGPANFGQSQFWPIQFWPIQFWPIQFWPIQFWPIQFWLIQFFGQFFWCHGGAPKGGAPKGGAPKGGAPKGGAPKGGAPKGGAPKGGAPKGGARRVGPRRVEAPTVGAQNFALSFPLPPQFFSFFPLFWSLSWNFGGVSEGRDAQMCTFGVLGLSCASPGGPVWWGRRGFTRQSESPNVHISGSRPSKTPPKFNEKDQEEREKRIKTVAGEGKKRAKFWAVRRRGVQRRGVRRRGPEHTHHTHTTTQKTHNTQHTHNKQAKTNNIEHFPTPKLLTYCPPEIMLWTVTALARAGGRDALSPPAMTRKW